MSESSNKSRARPLLCPCDGRYLQHRFSYDAPPVGEPRFKFASAKVYSRQVLCCAACGHYVSVHQMDASSLYAGDYVNSNYGDPDGLRRSFQRIVAMDPARSDNAGRVGRVLEFASRRLPVTKRSPSVLDVGSGLCVFLHGLKQAGWNCTAVDPDPRAAGHARDTVGVAAVVGDFLTVEGLARFDLITFNKVLEHVDDPVAMLVKSKGHLTGRGLVYIEVPDGETAALHGKDRQEFYIDHPNIFSAASLAMMATRAGFAALEIQRMHEPSDKYSLFAFVSPITA